MHKKLLALLLFVTAVSFAQTTIKGTLKDISTNQPIELATISADGTNIVTVSNSEGTFRITVPQSVTQVTISHLSYRDYTIKKEQFGQEDIFLEPSGIELEEVVVSNLTPQQMLKQVVDKTKKRLEKSLLLNTYYREFIKVDGTYTKFSDGLLDFNVKNKSGKADVYVKQSRAVRLADAKSNTPESTEAIDALTMFEVDESIADGYNLKMAKRILASPVYTFEIKTRTGNDGKSINIVKIIPNPDYEGLLYEGTIIYDTATELILDVDVKTAESHKKYAKEINIKLFSLKFTVYDHQKKTSFKLDGDKYIMTYNRHLFDVKITFRDDIDNTFLFMSDNLVMDYKEGEFDFDRSKRFKEKSLFKAGTNYTEEFWKTANAIPLTTEEESVIKNLETVK
ncbi:carboxypeptidase-like regulatory domain-containing protein [Flavobacterium sp. RHBU_3]|uniref:carboxypeptidase-like regulatory domain-containing protein n=1 Tax=Flavobacterium sp. RHBU_3 TaxID=3391184 RepID=UPI003984C74E